MNTSRRGIVLLPAIAGVNAYIRGVTKRLVSEDWQVEIIDYFAGTGPPDLTTAESILAAVDGIRADAVLGSISDATRALNSRGAGPVAILGYCVGGSLALLAGCRVEAVSAIANYYGALHSPAVPGAPPCTPLDLAESLRTPMIAHYGTADHFVGSDDVDALESHLVQSARTFELFRYGGAPHAFDEADRSSFRPVASQEAWRRTLAFLDWYVR